MSVYCDKRDTILHHRAYNVSVELLTFDAITRVTPIKIQWMDAPFFEDIHF